MSTKEHFYSVTLQTSYTELGRFRSATEFKTGDEVDPSLLGISVLIGNEKLRVKSVVPITQNINIEGLTEDQSPATITIEGAPLRFLLMVEWE